MPKNPNELNGLNEPLPDGGKGFAYGELPEFGGGFEAHEVGEYVVILPGDLHNAWDSFQYKPTYPGAPKPGTRVTLQCEGATALQVVSSPGGVHNGDQFRTRFSGAERKRDKDGNIIASDLDYLLQACGYKGKKPGSNQELADTVIQHCAAKQIAFKNEYQARCNPDKDRYIVTKTDPTTGRVLETAVEQGKKGCGESYYHGDIPVEIDKATGQTKKAKAFGCACGAWLRCFDSPTNLRGLTK